MVQADALTQSAIMDSLWRGRFYSSTGPEIHSLVYDGLSVAVTTSPAQVIRLVGPASFGKRIGSIDGPAIMEARFDVPVDWGYAYLEVEDPQGRRAWTNTLFTEGGISHHGK